MCFALESILHKTIDQRKLQLSKSGRCFMCTKLNHSSFSYPDKEEKCKWCNCTGHFAPMCAENLRKRPASDAGNSSSSKPGTFLQTFICQLITSDSKLISARGILDGGNDTSYIHEPLINRLSIPSQEEIMLSIQPYDSQKHVKISSCRFLIDLHNLNGDKRSYLFSTPFITDATQLAPPPHQASELLPIYLDYADPDLFNAHQRHVEILLGSDNYFKFVKLNRNRRLPNDLVPLNTFFGFIPAGSTNLIQCHNLSLTQAQYLLYYFLFVTASSYCLLPDLK